MNEEEANAKGFDMEMAAYEQIAKAAKEWVTKWPNHCQNCSGWGGWHIRATRWEPEDFDICTALPDGSCHRCGARDAQEEAADGVCLTPCKFCGWNFDDGAPQT